jgi:autophagy-related protein 18
MNLGDKSNNEILFLNFNQDFSCVSIGTERGYRIYNCDPFGKCYSKGESFFLYVYQNRDNSSSLSIAAGGTGIVEMLFCTSLVALVGAGEHPAFSPRQLQIINTKVGSPPPFCY